MSMKKFAQSVSEDIDSILNSISMIEKATSLDNLGMLREDKKLIRLYNKLDDLLFELYNYVETMSTTLTDYEKPSREEDDISDIDMGEDILDIVEEEKRYYK